MLRLGNWGLAFMTLTSMAIAQQSSSTDAKPFGQTRSGQTVHLHTIGNDQLTARITEYGATLVELHVADRLGKMVDVVLGWDDVSGYESDQNQYFGCTTGRVCNRIAKGSFQLDGKTYNLAVNNGPNHLHGGVTRSLSKVIWTVRPFRNQNGQGLECSYNSPDGEEGYPGNLSVKVVYFVPKNEAVLKIDYSAKSDKRTPVNLTNHSYFNLAGAGAATVLDHLLKLNADGYTPVDDTLIPTGKIQPVKGTPLDFRQPRKIGESIAQLVTTPTLGYDHNFVLNEPENGQNLRLAAELTDPKSGRLMQVRTTEPGVQFYSGNFLMGQTAKGGKTYAQQSAVCLETQHFPDSVNQKDFPTTILDPSKEFLSSTEFRFSTIAAEK